MTDEELKEIVIKAEAEYETLKDRVHFQYQEIIKLKEILKKAWYYNEHLIRDAKYHLNQGHLRKMRNILKEGIE